MSSFSIALNLFTNFYLTYVLRHAVLVVMDMSNLAERGLEYGQREPLTRRIKTLLKDYPDGLPVPKELLQNADDAQATKACLFLDLRSHSTENLINPKLAQFQGPALVFWNNKAFKKTDFENLCEFGGETKLNDRKKLGKFGLGFNSVYNLTDVPQFVSDEYYCILDPHEKFLNGRRGVQFPLTNCDDDGVFLADLIKGHLEPFESLASFSLEKVKNGTPFEGTIFRLPLRTAEQIMWSKISDKEYTVQSARELIEMTKSYADLFLLFLHFVNDFQISIIHHSFSVKKVASFKRTFIDGSGPSMAQVLFREDEIFRGSYQIAIEESIAKRTFHWDIFLSVPGLRSELDGTRCVGEIAFPSNDLKLESNTNNQLLFCFLPLPHPPSTGLPFLVNGSFAVTSSRRHLELDAVDDKSDQKRIEGQWNRDILQRAAAPALCDAVLSKASTHTQDQLFNLFPNYSNETNHLGRILSHAFYQKLTSDPSMKVFRSRKTREFLAFTDRRFVVISDDIPEDIRASLMNCVGYSRSSHIWVSLAANVQTSLKQFNAALLKAKEKSFPYFLNELIVNAEPLFIHNRTDCLKIMNHALFLSYSNPEIKKILITVPWVAVSPYNDSEIVMKMPNQLVHPKSKVAEILHFSTNFFPSDLMKLTENELSHMCQFFGMNSTVLPSEAIPHVIVNLNTLTVEEDLIAHFKRYVEHLNLNEQYYSRDRFLAELVIKNLQIPKIQNAG